MFIVSSTSLRELLACGRNPGDAREGGIKTGSRYGARPRKRGASSDRWICIGLLPRGGPKSHLRIRDSGRKRTLSTRGIGPAKRWYCYGDYIHVSTDVTQISITIPPRSMVLYHNYFKKISKMRAPGRPETARNKKNTLFASRYHCILSICIVLL